MGSLSVRVYERPHRVPSTSVHLITEDEWEKECKTEQDGDRKSRERQNVMENSNLSHCGKITPSRVNQPWH